MVVSGRIYYPSRHNFSLELSFALDPQLVMVGVACTTVSGESPPICLAFIFPACSSSRNIVGDCKVQKIVSEKNDINK
jgi:hypothetical protein